MRIDLSALRETFNELVLDVEHAKKLDTGCNSISFIKRTYTRAFFAMIEGLTYQLKRIALHGNEIAPKKLTTSEVLLLEETDRRLNENGTVNEFKAKLSMLPNLQFAVRTVSSVFSLDFTLNKELGWEEFRKAVKVRDRITHPKSLVDLEIDNADLATLGKANEWFRDEMVRLLNCLRERHDVE